VSDDLSADEQLDDDGLDTEDGIDKAETAAEVETSLIS